MGRSSSPGGPPGTLRPAPTWDLAGLLEEVARYIRRYVVLSDPQAVACTLWVAHCHAFAAAEATPYLHVTSAVKQCGKTRLLEVLEPLVPAPWLTGRVSAAVLTRKVDGETPTLLLDESDAAFSHRGEYAEALRSLLNSGYRRSGRSSLCVGQGAGLTYRDFATYCPKALAGIGALPDTVTDRSIQIALKRRAPHEPVARFRLRHAPRVGASLRAQLDAWRGRAVEGLRDAEPALPPALGDRRRCVGTAARHCRPGGGRVAESGPPRRDNLVRASVGGRRHPRDPPASGRPAGLHRGHPRVCGPGLPVGPPRRPSLGRRGGGTADHPSASRLRRTARVVSRDPMMSDDLTNAVFELANVAMLLDVSALYFASREIQAHGAALLRTIATVGTVDAAIGVASYRAGTTGWTRPVFQSRAARSTMADLRHPLLAEAVPNSITLAPPHGVIVTGSNMSGKSTFLRTIGVNTVLAQTVNTCLATEYSAPVFTVRSVIGRGDDLLSGTSYYKDEVEAVLTLVHLSRSRLPHLFLFDELFRGTSTAERIAAGEAVLAELISDDDDQEDQTGSPHIVIAATHDREFVDLLRGVYASYHFSDTVGSGGLSFNYRLREGPARSRNAIALLELYGAPVRIVQRARARLADPEA